VGAALLLFRMMKILAWQQPARWPYEDRHAMRTLLMTDAELAAWLRLSVARGLKPAALRAPCLPRRHLASTISSPRSACGATDRAMKC
jgi:hypothetical protein